ncbi:MAG: RnfABCDGE type electron transport complex subunit A [Elusimicrobiota bacterium]|nr:RnfABCDGE type electron transport complex subunit A [Elusimicrobiota bacterium]
MSLAAIFLSAVLVNNFVLYYFLGICPFLGVSSRIDSSLGIGMATTFVMTMTVLVTWPLYYYVISPDTGLNLPFLEYVIFILVIASLVQFVEMFIRKFFSNLYKVLGIYLPLITTNCAILGMALFMVLREYNYLQSMVFGFSAGVGFTLVITIMAGIREDIKYAPIPEVFKGAPVTLIIAGLLALAFMGFSGIVAP